MSTPAPILQYTLNNKDLLPAGYTPLAYIESSGTLWINSGIALNGSTSTYQIICKVGASIRDSHAHSFFGTSSYLTGLMGIYHYTNNNYYSEYILNANKGTLNLVIPKGNIFEYYLRIDMSAKTYASRIAYASEVTGSFTAMSNTSDTIRVFKSDDYPGGYWKCYYFRIIKDNVLQADLRPCVQDSNGAIGMYDLVSRSFKANAGSGTFIAGPPLAVGKGGGKSLPEEYLLVEYIENVGTSGGYINLNYYPTNGIKTEFDWNPTQVLLYFACILGNHNNSSSNNYERMYVANRNDWEIGLLGTYNRYGTVVLNKRYKVEFNSINSANGYLKLSSYDNTSILNLTLTQNNGQTFSSTKSVWLLFSEYLLNHGSDGNVLGYPTPGKLGQVKLWDNNNVLVRNMIPCYRKSDMKPGMYDVVNGVFYTNSGSGEFILGPTVTNYYTWEPNAGSGTQQGLYTNVSSAYDSSKGWVADFSNNTTHLSTKISAVGNTFSVAWWELSSDFNGGSMPWAVHPLNPLYNKCLNTGDGNENPWYKSGTTAIDNITNGVWHHFVVTGNGSANYLYVDGVKKGLSKTFKGLGGTSLVMNGWLITTSYCRNPKIYNFLIFNVALTDAQVKELYGQ